MKHYKDGFHSLLWQWQPGDRLTLRLGRRVSGKMSGIKIWIYRNQSSISNLTISLIDSTAFSNQAMIISFNFSLNFKGWRAAWVGLREAESLPKNPGYDQVVIDSPSENVTSKVIFVDLLCLATNVHRQSRDEIVPPIGKSIYTITSLWQQVYKWSRVIPPPVDGTTPLNQSEKEHLGNLTLIEKRLLNWFANESLGPSHYTGNLKKRWESLVVLGFQKARRLIKELNITITDGILTGSPLFTKYSAFGSSQKIGRNKKLGLVTNEVLFPLTLEYYFSTKPQHLRDQVTRELVNVNRPVQRRAAVMRITKGDEILCEFMLAELEAYNTPISPRVLRNVLDRLNEKKLETILQLLEYISDQGWSEGSGFGSLDHEMNKAGSGFMHSLYLLKPVLARKGKLESVMKTMKWYNEFGEVYQTNFEFNGTSADRMRTIILYRLETVLMNPERTIKEQREKLRDMAAYSRWCNNALLVNTAFEGVFKPDLSCFHHLAVYGPAYSPEALTVAALVYYLLDGTSFSLNPDSRKNIRDRLDSYQEMALLYSIPNSIAGRFPGYSSSTLIKMLPAFSHLSAGSQNLQANGELEPFSLGPDIGMVETFRRLYRPHYPNVVEYLRNGTPGPTNEYLFSLGALETMEAIYSKAKQANITARKSPTGHWVRNYAALSIHRRENWAVSVKGFNRFIWDYESSNDENVYGLYASHGALQISNSEESLKAYDVENGWDWTRIPGTTTVKMNLDQMVSRPSARYYQQSNLVGGVTLVSKDAKLANGVFAMRFQQPRYDFPAQTFKSKIEFYFKKSVFFYNDLIVCLGSDINVEKSDPNRTQTTLFQDKLVKPSATSTIYINGVAKWLRHDLRLRTDISAAMLDTNGNGYYVPKDSPLNIQISRQLSRKSSGEEVSSARYATAWLDHGVNPLSAHYEYAILVATNAADIEALKAAQNSSSPRYVVLQKNSEAHVVMFTNSVSASRLYGYAFYDRKALTNGPVRHVSAECIVMAEVDGPNFSDINISINSPDLNFNTSKILNTSEDNGVNEYFYMRSQPVEITVELKNPVSLNVQRVLVDGKTISKSELGGYVEVEPDDPLHRSLGGRRVIFKRLVNGESVEAHLVGRGGSEAELI